MGKRYRPKKEPSLFRKVIEAYWERGQEKKAERELARLTWSLDFIAEAVARASRLAGDDIAVTIKNANGSTIELMAKGGKIVGGGERSIFDRLDDDLAVEDFIRRNSVR